VAAAFLSSVREVAILGASGGATPRRTTGGGDTPKAGRQAAMELLKRTRDGDASQARAQLLCNRLR
jgi:hypothetical protein